MTDQYRDFVSGLRDGGEVSFTIDLADVAEEVLASLFPQRGHEPTVTDDGARTTLTCSCEAFAVVSEIGTAAERQAAMEHWHAWHLARVEPDKQPGTMKAEEAELE